MSVTLVTRMKLYFFAMWNFSCHKCPSFPDPWPASLGTCYVQLELKDSFTLCLFYKASKPPPQAFSFSSLSFTPQT